jgi:CHAD domain-containing protein
MSYRFEGKESAAEAVHRIAIEQFDEALAHARARANLDDAIHDVRVCFKKLRALIRLVRPELGAKQYRHENVSFRDLNRRLSGLRDAAALTESFEKLKERYSSELAEDAFDSIRTSLTRRKRSKQADKKKALAEVAKEIVAMRNRVEKWSIEDHHFAVVGEGLMGIYARGQAGLEQARARQSVGALHEWRKEVKYLWYHVTLLRKLWPKELKRFAKQIETLAEFLSDDHDLAILRERVLEVAKDAKDDHHECEALMALIDKRRAELQIKACFLGERIYAEKPKAFRSRFQEYWRAWRDEEKTDPLAAT